MTKTVSAVRNTEIAHLSEVGLTINGVQILSDISLSVGLDEIVGLVGSNGAGKSSVANVLCGYYRPTKGKVFLNGTDVTHTPAVKFTDMGVRRSFQNVSYLRGLSINELVMLDAEATWPVSFLSSYLLRRSSKIAELKVMREATELLGSVGLGSYEHRMVEDCPYGVRKFADVVRAFMAPKSTIVILDEPTSGIGEVERSLLTNMIQALRESRSIGALLVVDHDVSFIRSLCSRIVVLEEGKVLTSGPADEVFEDRRVISSFVGSRRKEL